jgi:hypothetical protein
MPIKYNPDDKAHNEVIAKLIKSYSIHLQMVSSNY